MFRLQDMLTPGIAGGLWGGMFSAAAIDPAYSRSWGETTVMTSENANVTHPVAIEIARRRPAPRGSLVS